jgi:hypothetical protein
MPKLAQASPVFSVPLGVLCVELLTSLSQEKLLTQRTQGGTEKKLLTRPEMLPLRIELGYKWFLVWIRWN